jgi:hypothetical protein
MWNYFRTVDGKLLCLGILGCFILPWLVVGTAFGAIQGLPNEIRTWASPFAMLFDLAGPPLFAGYIAARFARNRPQLHALLLTMLGITAYFLFGSGTTLEGVATIGVVYLACAALGTIVALRRARRRRA